MSQLDKGSKLMTLATLAIILVRTFINLLISISFIIGNVPTWYRIFLILVGVITSIDTAMVVSNADNANFSKVDLTLVFCSGMLIYVLYAEFSLLPLPIKIFTIAIFIVENVLFVYLCIIGKIGDIDSYLSDLLNTDSNGIELETPENLTISMEKEKDDCIESGDLVIFFKLSYIFLLEFSNKGSNSIVDNKVHWFKSVDELIDWVDIIDDGYIGKHAVEHILDSILFISTRCIDKHDVEPLSDSIHFDNFTHYVFRKDIEYGDITVVGYYGYYKNEKKESETI